MTWHDITYHNLASRTWSGHSIRASCKPGKRLNKDSKARTRVRCVVDGGEANTWHSSFKGAVLTHIHQMAWHDRILRLQFWRSRRSNWPRNYCSNYDPDRAQKMLSGSKRTNSNAQFQKTHDKSNHDLTMNHMRTMALTHSWTHTCTCAHTPRKHTRWRIRHTRTQRLTRTDTTVQNGSM